MRPASVLVIEEGAEATLVRAALAKQPAVRVLEAPDSQSRVALAIAGARALNKSAEELKKLEARGIPVVAIVPKLTPAARQRALAAGAREIHERPREWQSYSKLIESLVGRFIPGAAASP